jgi:hypothetical protein
MMTGGLEGTVRLWDLRAKDLAANPTVVLLGLMTASIGFN